MKICELLDSYYPCIDGPINVVQNYSRLLNEKSPCKLAVPKASKKSGYVDKESFEVLRCNSTPAPEKYRCGHPLTDCEFLKRVDGANFDIFHAHAPFAMGRFALKMGKKYKVPVVATMHTQYKKDFERVLKGCKPLVRIMMWYIMKVYNKADSVWTVNDSSCKILREYGYKGKIEVVRNGTDLKYPENPQELIDKVNNLHNLKGQKNVFIFIGRIAMYKNLPLIVDSLKILKDAGEDFKMIIIGGGPDESKLRQMVEENGLNDNFVFAGVISDRTLLQGYYLRSDLFLFPSTFDTSSLVPIEAAAHKLPTLLIKDSCTAENIVDGVNGFLSEENANAYAKRIKEIISDDGLLKIVGEECHRSVYRSWEKVAEEVYGKYQEVIKEYKIKMQKNK